MAQRQLYSGLDLYDWRGTGPNGRTKAVEVDKWQQNQEDIRHLPGAFPVQSVVITDGQITPTAAALSVDTEGGTPADDLTAIAPGDLHAGMLLALCSADAGRKITIKNSAGASGIQTLDGKDVVLDTQYAVMLRLVSTESLTLWREEPGPLRLQLTVSTPDTLGGVKVQTGDDDGLEMIGDKLRVRQAGATQRGSVLASETAQTGAVPLGGDSGKFDASWLPPEAVTLFNTRLVITESNASWTPPVTGWARVMVIGGGGAGMSVAESYYTGGSGGDSSFGSLTAKGGRAGMSGSSVDATIPDAGGYAGEIVIEYIYISEDTQISIVIGAGGIAGKTNSQAGYIEYPGTAHTWATSGPGTTYYGSGGNGGSNGTKYGGGGGSAGVGKPNQANAMKGGVGAGGGKNGSGYSGTPNSTLVKGGNGGHGAVIIEYYDPAKEGA